MLGAEESKLDKRMTASRIRRSADKPSISNLHKIIYQFKGSSKILMVSAQCNAIAT